MLVFLEHGGTKTLTFYQIQTLFAHLKEMDFENIISKGKPAHKIIYKSFIYISFLYLFVMISNTSAEDIFNVVKFSS